MDLSSFFKRPDLQYASIFDWLTSPAQKFQLFHGQAYFKLFFHRFLKDFTASLHDFFGGRAGSYERTLIEAKENAMNEMSMRASQLGANAILSIDIDYETVGQSGSMLMVACSGTAVRID